MGPLSVRVQRLVNTHADWAERTLWLFAIVALARVVLAVRGRHRGGATSLPLRIGVLDLSDRPIPMGRATIGVSAVGGHYKGMVGDETVVHGHRHASGEMGRTVCSWTATGTFAS